MRRLFFIRIRCVCPGGESRAWGQWFGVARLNTGAFAITRRTVLVFGEDVEVSLSRRRAEEMLISVRVTVAILRRNFGCRIGIYEVRLRL